MSGKPTVVLDARSMARTLRRMADEVVELFSGTDDLILVGIQRRGVQLADRIADFIDEREGVRVARGALDITLYRDDLQTIGPRPVVGKTSLPLSLDNRKVVIVDDVLYTGRTVRAAMDELADFGRDQVIGHRRPAGMPIAYSPSSFAHRPMDARGATGPEAPIPTQIRRKRASLREGCRRREKYNTPSQQGPDLIPPACRGKFELGSVCPDGG